MTRRIIIICKHYEYASSHPEGPQNVSWKDEAMRLRVGHLPTQTKHSTEVMIAQWNPDIFFTHFLLVANYFF